MNLWQRLVERFTPRATPAPVEQITYTKAPALGLRQNNPFNLRPLPRSTWLGQTGVANGFCVFGNVGDGIRAGALNLRNQKRLHGIDTIEELLYKYAPPSENDTEAYIRSVCMQTGYSRDLTIDLENRDVLLNLSRAIIKHEQGQQPFPPGVLTVHIGRALAA